MTDLITPAHTHHRISVRPTELAPGDQIRDHGRLRTITKAHRNDARPGFIVVSFDDGGDTLSIPADDPAVTVTAWRNG